MIRYWCLFYVVLSSISTAAIANNAEKYGAEPYIRSMALSPNGEKIAWVSPGPKGATVGYVADVATGVRQQLMQFDGDPDELDWCEFISESYLVCSLSFQQKLNGNFRWLSRIFSVGTDGKNLNVLSPKEYWAGGGWILNWLHDQPNKLKFVDGFGIRTYDATKGEFEESRYYGSKSRHEEHATSYIDDSKGVIRIMGVNRNRGATGYADRVTRYYYRDDPEDAWKLLSSRDGLKDAGFRPLRISDSNEAIGIDQQEGKDALFAISLDGSKTRRLVYSHPKVDVSNLITLGRDGRIIGFSYAEEKTKSVYVDDEYAKLAKSLGNAIPGLPNISILDASLDENRLLMFASSDRNPGKFYFFDKKERRLEEIFSYRPKLDEKHTASVKPITYEARDGTKIPGYLTLPSGGQKPVGAIVMPHGGPESRDVWGFDWWAQFFAAEGYAVLQPNFRGSYGYGKDWFVENGFKSWRTAVGDVNDAGRWLISEGIASPDKLALVGWSYGGYAGLQSGVSEPNLFKAIIAVAPVTDLSQLKNDSKFYRNHANLRDYIGKGEHIKSGSPAKHAVRISAPVLLFHGTADTNVDIRQSKSMVRALKKAGKQSELVVYDKQDHSISGVEQRTDMLKKSAAFLAQHIK